ncbi:MAG TPA: hypothetical protein P5527_08695, partial [Kiritimatiellia bacterium]|nr:hypothetical protein [Kiritimatiellia bacterium]
MKRAFMFCLLLACVAVAGSQNNDLMPDGFEQIHIGMDWRSLVALRPNAEIMNMMPDSGEALKPDPERPGSGLFENLPESAVFSVVYYNFEDGVLVAVMFGKEKGRSTPLERESAIRRVGQGRGEPTKIQLTGKRHDQGVISWQDQNLHINVMVPTDEAHATQSVVGLQVMDRKYAERINAIGSVDDTEMEQAQQGADKLRLEAFKSKEALAKPSQTQAVRLAYG